MKRLIVIVMTVIALLAMTVPAMAITTLTGVTTTASVGGGSATPYMIAMWMTPDEIPGPGTDIYPEPAIPNSVVPLFPNNDNTPSPPGDKTKDGWKRVNIYLMADIQYQGYRNIAGVSVNVTYPNGDLKFEVDAAGDPTTKSWTASQSGYAPETYPGDIAATPPQPNTDWHVRQLSYTDIVDTNADGYVTDDSDQAVGPFLTAWGNKVVYGMDPANNISWNATSAGAKLQSDEALLLELQGWVWFHQPALTYTVQGSALAGYQSPPLTNTFNFVATVNLYLDFTSLNYGTVTPGVEALVQGDTNLATPGSPTIWDNGNIDAKVTINATRMVLNGNPLYYDNLSKTIRQFDAALYYKDADGNNLQVGYVTFPAGTPKLIENDMLDTKPVKELGLTGPVRLQACRPAKIDLSVLPGTGLVNGNYTGTMTISIAAFEDPNHG